MPGDQRRAIGRRTSDSMGGLAMHRVLIAIACFALGVPAAFAAATPRHTVNLATGEFDGHMILGLTPAQVKAALGKPDSAHGSRARYLFDWGTFSNLRFRVIFTSVG